MFYGTVNFDGQIAKNIEIRKNTINDLTNITNDRKTDMNIKKFIGSSFFSERKKK